MLKLRSIDAPAIGVSFRQLRTCRRTRPGRYVPEPVRARQVLRGEARSSHMGHKFELPIKREVGQIGMALSTDSLAELSASPMVVPSRNEAKGDAAGGTADMVQKAQERGAKTIILNTKKIFAD